jgi:transposase
MSNRRYELTDEEWTRIEALLPAQKPATGRENMDHRTIVNGMIWVLRSGAPWRDLPERYGKWTTVYSRFQRWSKAGVWGKVLSALQEQADAQGTLNWDVHFVDGSVIRAHQHAAGAKKVTQRPKP